MSNLDWFVLFGTLLSIVAYGVYASRGSHNIEGFLLGDKSMRWWTIGLSVVATQASAITFLSTPGQAYEDGMRFIQIYLGQPIAVVILCVTIIPIFLKLKVYTAYEFLENRFDLKTRTLASFLFFLQRGLQAGITIFAPSIILSSILDLSLEATNLIIGLLVVIYTVSGGTKAVSITQKQQMAVMMGGMILAGIVIIYMLPEEIGFGDALNVAGKLGKLETVDLEFDLTNRYNIWSGIIGGLFIGLSYFGTDQSQVQRYLSGRSVRESRLGLIFHGLFKLPMQFIILFIGAMVFVFYQFYAPPVFFNEAAVENVKASEYREQFETIEQEYQSVFEQKRGAVEQLVQAEKNGDEEGVDNYVSQVHSYIEQEEAIRDKAKLVITEADPDAETNDTDYVFITFIMKHLPHGLIGLLLAVIFSAAMSSTASELNALASTTTVDIYKRSLKPGKSDRHYLAASRVFTLMWGLIAISFAMFASLLENLIELVNIVGSIFYGSILGIFVVALYLKYVKGNAIFIATILAQSMVIFLFVITPIGYLWYNVIGCVLVILFSLIIQRVIK